MTPQEEIIYTQTNYRTDQKAVRAQNLYKRFLDMIDYKYRTLHQVSEYAEILHVSMKTLRESVKSAGDTTPLRVIHDKLILKAKTLLQQPTSSMKHTAHFLGYEDVAHFSKLFKKVTGTSPSEYQYLSFGSKIA